MVAYDSAARTPARDVEKAILDVLAQIAPDLTGYDPEASVAERTKRIEAWLAATAG